MVCLTASKLNSFELPVNRARLTGLQDRLKGGGAKFLKKILILLDRPLVQFSLCFDLLFGCHHCGLWDEFALPKTVEPEKL